MDYKVRHVTAATLGPPPAGPRGWSPTSVGPAREHASPSGGSVAGLLLLTLRNANRPASVQVSLMSQPSTPRFAIATFDQGEHVALAVQALARLGIDPKSLELLATRQAFQANTGALAEMLVGQPRDLQFPDNAEVIECTPGPVATLLAEGRNKGVRGLAEALDISVFPHLAKALERDVEEHRLLLWVPIHNDEDERKAGLTLLALKPRSYQVHDLVAQDVTAADGDDCRR